MSQFRIGDKDYSRTAEIYVITIH